jgi:hypothetical protein
MEYAQSLMKLGYEITDRPKQGFEISGVPQETIERFSQRSLAIEKYKQGREDANLNPYQYRSRAYIERPDKVVYAETYDAYVEQQKERLTHAERISLKNTVEVAEEKSHKLRIQWNVGEAEDSGPEIKQWSYGHRLAL